MCRRFYCLIFVVFAGLFLTGVCSAVAPDPTYYYKLDEPWGSIAMDSSGNDYDGRIISGSDVNWAPTDGYIGGAASFFETGNKYDQILIPSAGMNNKEGTVAIWGKRNTNLGVQSWPCLFGHGNNVFNNRVCIRQESQSTGIRLGLGGEPDVAGHICDFPDGWQHIVLTWQCNDLVSDPNNGKWLLYKNSIKMKGGAYTGIGEFYPLHPNDVGGLNIGNNGDPKPRTGDRDGAFLGLLDEVGIWDVNLPAADVSYVYTNGVPQPTFAWATGPTPRNKDFDVAPCPNDWRPDPNLSWLAGDDATSHDVYFGTDYNDVNDANNSGSWDEFKGNQTGTQYDPGLLEYGKKKYYWRIDERGSSLVKGKTWSFTTDDGKATDEDPEDDDDPSAADETAPSKILSWLPGATADTHKVYLGTNEQNVNDANDSGSWDEYKGTGTYTCTDANRVCFDPGVLTMATVYYWRVDEVNSVYGTVKGDIWGFKVFSHRTIDDFETYDTGIVPDTHTWTKELKAPWLKIIAGEDDGADDSNQWMEMAFAYPAGEPSYSEMWRNAPDADLTTGGLTKALALYYRSDDPDAPFGQTIDFNEMYVRLEEKAGAGGDTNTVTLAGPNGPDMDGDWHQWNIDLEDFNEPDMDLTNIAKIHIGVGDGTDRGYGLVFFDEIRLYAPRCMPDLLDLDGDINNDCKVDFEDIADMEDDWLDSDYNSVGYDGFLYHTTVRTPGFVAGDGCWVPDPCRGQALDFGGQVTQDWVDITDIGLCEQGPDEPNGFQNRTVCLWIKNNDPQTHPIGYAYRARIFETQSYSIEISIDGGDQRPDHEGELRCRVEDIKYPLHCADKVFTLGDWHHAAIVLNNTLVTDMVPALDDPNAVLVEIYFDGALAASADRNRDEDEVARRHTGERLNNVHLNGNNDHDNGFIAVTLDDFRIYDYNMPATDVNELYMLERDGSTDSYKDSNLLVWLKFDDGSGDIAHDSGKSKDDHIYYALDTSSNIIEKVGDEGEYNPDNKDIVNFVDYAALADDWLIKKIWPEP